MKIRPLKRIERFVRRIRYRLQGRSLMFPDISHLLHHLRGEAFKRAPRGAKTLVSVGCAGTWYFDWIRETYGPVDRHIGVEFYSPRPSNLPPGVEWVANTAGSMPEIGTAAADAVISGENLEHLWPEDVCGFFLESHRILRPGGILMIDSPNRSITSRYGWSHPEHTVELTAAETVRMTTLAGFDVTAVKGLWLCESLEGDTLYPFDEMKRSGSRSIHNRMKGAEAYPEKSFLWWIEARKAQRVPEEAALRSLMAAIWNEAWPERCRRTVTGVGKAVHSGTKFRSRGTAGPLMYGPYLPLRKGSYTATFRLRLDSHSGPTNDTIHVDVVGRDGSLCLSRRDIPVVGLSRTSPTEVSLQWSVEETTFGIQFRVIVPAKATVEVDRDVALKSFGGW